MTAKMCQSMVCRFFPWWCTVRTQCCHSWSLRTFLLLFQIDKQIRQSCMFYGNDRKVSNHLMSVEVGSALGLRILASELRGCSLGRKQPAASCRIAFFCFTNGNGRNSGVLVMLEIRLVFAIDCCRTRKWTILFLSGCAHMRLDIFAFCKSYGSCVLELDMISIVC